MKNHYKISLLKMQKQMFSILKLSNGLNLRLLLLVLPLQMIAQNEGNKKVVNSIVINDSNEPLADVSVYSSSANSSVFTNKNGNFTSVIEQFETLTFELDGFVKKTLSFETITDTIVLQTRVPKFADNQEVNLAFTKKNSQSIVGQIGYVNTADFSDIDKSQSIGSIIDGRVSGISSAFNLRSFGTALLVIDGVPRNRNYLNNMNTMEVAQVTVLKGVHSVALFGEEAINGAVLITTKRGKVGRNEINTYLETGISVPKRKPNYLGAAEYMTLFNEASLNDWNGIGLAPKLPYTQEQIDGTIAQDNPYRYPDVDYYSKEFIDDFALNSRVITEFTGGKDDTRYYVNMGFNTSSDIVNILEIKNKRNDFNVRANVDFRISNFLTANLDVVGYLVKFKGPNPSFYLRANSYLPNEFAPLLPISLFDDPDLIENSKLIDGQFLAGGNQNFPRNIYADYAFGGEKQETGQNFQFNNGLNFDLSGIIKGLSAKTYLSFDYYNRFQDKQERTYAVYDLDWIDGVNGEDIPSISDPIGADVAEPNRTVTNTHFRRNFSVNAQINYSKNFKESNIAATVLGYHRTKQSNKQFYADVYNHLGFNVNYNYKDKYIVDFASSYITSRKLAEGNRGGFAPTVALGWIASRESFLKDSKVVDHLKLNISAGTNKGTNLITSGEEDGYYLYEDSFGISNNSYKWNDGGRSGRLTQLVVNGNPNLTYIERNEVNVGLEAVLFKSVSINASYFNTKIEGLPVNLSSIYTAFIGARQPLTNFNANLYEGLDFGINYQKRFGDFSIETGLTGIYVTNKRIQYDEEDNLPDYQKREGKIIDAITGLESLGFFESLEDIANSPSQNNGQVSPGDIKYKDQNDDNVITDDDRIILGDTQADIEYGINLALKYKGFSLFALGTGQMGGEAINNSNYFWVSGNDKYSEVVRNRWTPETAATATYPRLSAGANNNNFRTSSFWKRSTDMFRISRIQLSFDFPSEVLSNLKVKKLGVYVRGSNLWTISKNRDIIDLNSNSLQFHYFNVGVVANF